MQGVLPPELLLFHDLKAPETLNTEQYIQYFRALKYRFIASRNAFTPDEIAQPSKSEAPVATGMHFPGSSVCGFVPGDSTDAVSRHNWSLATALDLLLNMCDPGVDTQQAASTVKLMATEECPATGGLPRYARGPTRSAAEETVSLDVEAVTSDSEEQWKWDAAEASSR
jgi:hypothetical protein